jgi:hypothetical protein
VSIMDLHTSESRRPLRRLFFGFSKKFCTLDHDSGIGTKDKVHNATPFPPPQTQKRKKRKEKKNKVIEGFVFLGKYRHSPQMGAIS